MDDLLKKLCKEKNLRLTPQRKAIARVLEEADKHLDVEAIYERTKLIDEKASIATVYRTLKLFEENGIVTAIKFNDDRTYYELVSNKKHHDHLINTKTGEIIEFHCEDIEAGQQKIAKRLGYKLTGHKLILYGVPE